MKYGPGAAVAVRIYALKAELLSVRRLIVDLYVHVKDSCPGAIMSPKRHCQPH